MRRRYSAEEWRAWLEEQPRSGLTVADFCDEIGVSPNSFYLWRRKLSAARRSRSASAAASRRRSLSCSTESSAADTPTFLPLTVVAARNVEIDLPCGAVWRRDPHSSRERCAAADTHGAAAGWGAGGMLNLAGGLRVFVCTQPADMRKSFDGLCGMVQQLVAEDPLSGHLFVFRNRLRDRLKILYWDRDGLAIWYKRLEAGTWQLPSDVRKPVAGTASAESKRASGP